MALDSQFHMPGAFTTTFSPPNSGSGSGFAPYDPGNASTKRKRNHDDYGTRIRDEKAVEALFAPPVHGYTTPVKGFAHRQNYALAGRLDTPGMESEFGQESMYSDADYRKMLGSDRPEDNITSPNDGVYSIFSHEQQQQHRQPTSNRGWGALAVNTLGGVVKGIWQFCKAGTFRGFHAGGGQGYSVDPSSGAYDSGADGYAHDYIPQQHFPQDQFDSESRCSSPGIPAPKRRQTAPMNDLGNNWVMVSDKGSAKKSASPRNRNSGPSVTTGRRIIASGRRPFTGRASLAPQPAPAEQRPASSASFASARSASPSVQPSPTHSRHNSNHLLQTPTSNRRPRASTQFAPSPRASLTPLRRRNSGASTASFSRPAANSPRLDAEAKKLAARRQREADDADYRISTFNKQLQDMIRQGKEALGTTVEIDGDGDGGGWESEDQ